MVVLEMTSFTAALATTNSPAVRAWTRCTVKTATTRSSALTAVPRTCSTAVPALTPRDLLTRSTQSCRSRNAHERAHYGALQSSTAFRGTENPVNLALFTNRSDVTDCRGASRWRLRNRQGATADIPVRFRTAVPATARAAAAF